MTNKSRLAVVTPYWRVETSKLARCMDSVRRQTVPAMHYLVADGDAVAIPDCPSNVHIALPQNTGNGGASPRGIGAMLAFNQGCDVVAFLDADNWFEPDHLAQSVSLIERERVDVVFARRRIVFPDGELLQVPDEQDESGSHVDTNCFVVSRRAAFLAGIWGMYPGSFGAGDDRLIPLVIRLMGLRTANMFDRTVWYETNWPLHYKLAGKRPTAPMRQPSRWVSTGFDPETYYRHTGIRLSIDPGPDRIRMPLATPQNWRVAVVTPYRGEPAADLQQCANSVRRQGSQFTHFVVCEGAVPDAVPEEVRVLPLPHCEIRHGCTARGIGAVLAFQLGFDAVVFLDAGRFLDDTYRERLLANAASSPADVLVLSAALSEGDISACADSGLANSLVVVRTAAYLGVLWSQLPALPTQEHAASLLLLLARAAGAAIRDVRDLGASASQVSVGTSIDGRVLFERTGFRLLADK